MSCSCTQESFPCIPNGRMVIDESITHAEYVCKHLARFTKRDKPTLKSTAKQFKIPLDTLSHVWRQYNAKNRTLSKQQESLLCQRLDTIRRYGGQYTVVNEGTEARRLVERFAVGCLRHYEQFAGRYDLHITILPQWLDSFFQKHPKYAVSLSEDELVTQGKSELEVNPGRIWLNAEQKLLLLQLCQQHYGLRCFGNRASAIESYWDEVKKGFRRETGIVGDSLSHWHESAGIDKRRGLQFLTTLKEWRTEMMSPKDQGECPFGKRKRGDGDTCSLPQSVLDTAFEGLSPPPCPIEPQTAEDERPTKRLRDDSPAVLPAKEPSLDGEDDEDEEDEQDEQDDEDEESETGSSEERSDEDEVDEDEESGTGSSEERSEEGEDDSLGTVDTSFGHEVTPEGVPEDERIRLMNACGAIACDAKPFVEGIAGYYNISVDVLRAEWRKRCRKGKSLVRQLTADQEERLKTRLLRLVDFGGPIQQIEEHRKSHQGMHESIIEAYANGILAEDYMQEGTNGYVDRYYPRNFVVRNDRFDTMGLYQDPKNCLMSPGLRMGSGAPPMSPPYNR